MRLRALIFLVNNFFGLVHSIPWIKFNKRIFSCFLQHIWLKWKKKQFAQEAIGFRIQCYPQKVRSLIVSYSSNLKTIDLGQFSMFLLSAWEENLWWVWEKSKLLWKNIPRSRSGKMSTRHSVKYQGRYSQFISPNSSKGPHRVSKAERRVFILISQF